MNDNKFGALMPVAMPTRQLEAFSDHRFTDDDITLSDRDEIRKQLPDILGRVLARIWIDPDFHKSFIDDPAGTLRTGGVILPATIHIDFSVKNGARPKVVVYEQEEGSNFKLRLFYLQLLMIAGR